MTQPSWTLLVPTIGERRASFERLMSVLLPQTEGYPGTVRVTAWHNNGQPHLTEIRQRMVETAETEYVSCIDDDDLVPPYFVDRAMEALEARPDYVGWQVQCYSDGVPTAIAYHSLKYRRWWNETTRYYRDISHINPIRTEHAQAVSFRRTARNQAEDRAWVQQLRASGRLVTEEVVDTIMYHYLFSTASTAGIGSRWQAPHKIHPGLDRAVIDHPNFSYHPESLDA